MNRTCGRLLRLGPLLTLLLLALFPAHPVSASTSDSPLRLVSQSSFVDPTGDFSATFAIDAEADVPAGTEIDVTIFSVLEGDADLAADPENLLHRLEPQPFPSSESQPETLSVDIKVRDDEDADPQRTLLPDAGVYPILIEVRNDTEVVQRLRTNLIRLAETDPTTSVSPPPLSLVIDATEQGMGLRSAMRLIEQADGSPLSIMIDQTTLERLEGEPTLTESFSQASNRATVILSSGTNEISALSAINETRLYEQRLVDLDNQAKGLGINVDDSVSVTSSVTQAGADTLTSLGRSTALRITENSQSTSTLDGFGVVTTPSGSLTVATSRPFKDTGPDDTVMWSHETLASIVLDRQLQPDDPSPTLLIVGTQNNVVTDDSFSTFLNADENVFQLTSIDQLVTSEKPFEIDGVPALDLAPQADLIGSLTREIATYESTHIDSVTSPTLFRERLIAQLNSNQTSDERAQALSELQVNVREEIQSLNLPAGQAVTVPAQSVSVPVLIENESDGSRRFLLRSTSDKVQIAQDGEILTVPPGKSSINVDIEVRSLGVSPVQISLFTPDGQNRLASTRFEVRSTAIPGLGLLLCMVGAGFLAFWWYVHAKKRRSERRATPSSRREKARDREPRSTNPTTSSSQADIDTTDVDTKDSSADTDDQTGRQSKVDYR